jgi:hypothetical protein
MRALERGDGGVEPRELLLDRSDDSALLINWRQWHPRTPHILEVERLTSDFVRLCGYFPRGIGVAEPKVNPPRFDFVRNRDHSYRTRDVRTLK